MKLVAAEVAPHLPATVTAVAERIGAPRDRWDAYILDLLPYAQAVRITDASLTLVVDQPIKDSTARIAHESVLASLADLLVETYAAANGVELPAVHIFPLTERDQLTMKMSVTATITGLVTA